MDTRTNWAGNYRYGAARTHHPETVEQLQEVVARSAKIKPLGTRHSFNGVGDSSEDLVFLDRLDGAMALDRERRTVTVGGGIRYGILCRFLHREGFALHNLASLPHISVAGACATATHGSGDGNGNLATAVSALEMVTADGALVTVARETDPAFPGAVVGLGGLGIVTRLTLDVEPTFLARQDVYENLPLAQLEAHFDEVMSSAYSVSLFTNWRGANFNQVWRKSRVAADGDAFVPESEWFGATPATRPLHPIPEMPTGNCTEQGGIPGPWFERLPHFRIEDEPSGSGDELQSEYFVPREHAVAALRAVGGLREHIAPVLLASEVRTIAADDLWMSPCCGQACAAFHFTWKPDWPAVRELLPRIEAALAPFDARPHWGKLFTVSPARLQTLYPKLPEFRALLRQYDPRGKFRNAFLDTYVLEE